jgi:hypothetical protein
MTSLAEQPPLHSAVRQLYDAFSRYRGRSHWSDPLDMKSAEEDSLVSRFPVSKLPTETFAYYAWHSLLLWGNNLPALKYFLPRIAENFLHDPRTEKDWKDHCDVGPEMTVSELNALEWQAWPAHERDAIHRFFAAWFSTSLNDSPPSPCSHPAAGFFLSALFDAPRVLAYLALLGTDIHSQLHEWRAAESTTALLHLATFFNESAVAIASQHKIPGWTAMWGKDLSVGDQANIIAIKWLITPATSHRLDDAFIAATDPRVQTALGEAIVNLQMVLDIWAARRGDENFPQWAAKILDNFPPHR